LVATNPLGIYSAARGLKHAFAIVNDLWRYLGKYAVLCGLAVVMACYLRTYREVMWNTWIGYVLLLDTSELKADHPLVDINVASSVFRGQEKIFSSR
jgi:hypothetical protein